MSAEKSFINTKNIDKCDSIDSDTEQGEGNFLKVLDEISSEEDEEPSASKIKSTKDNINVDNNNSSVSINKTNSSKVDTSFSQKCTTPVNNSSKVNENSLQKHSNYPSTDTNSPCTSKDNTITQNIPINITNTSKENTVNSNDNSSVSRTSPLPPPQPPQSSTSQPTQTPVSLNASLNKKKIGELDEDADEIVLALIWSKGKLGAASYNMSTSVLSVMDDIVEDTFNFNITKALYMQLQPRHIVTTSGTPDDFQSILKKLIIKDSFNNQNKQSTSSSTSSSIDQVSLNILNKNQNDFEYCYHRVKLLKLNSEPDDTTNSERITFLNSVLNFDSNIMIHSLGLLLKYLDENWSKLTLNPSEKIEYLYINSIMLNDLVMMDEDTFNVLNIMQSKFHPSLFKYGSCSIEIGMNLFTFLNRCQSRPGVQYLWKLMRHPTRNINIINERHKIIEFFINPNNENYYKNIKSSLKQISRLTPAVLKRYKTPQAKPADWKKLSKTISHLTIIGDICKRCKNISKIFNNIYNSINDDIHRVRYFIDYIIDHDESKQQGRFIVMDGVDPYLDELNYRKRCLPKLLTEAAEKELKNLPNIINGFRYVYLPGIGYLVVITEWNRNLLKDKIINEEEQDIPGLEFIFSSNGTRHYKSNGARELDDNTGDIVRMITCREKQIMLRLIEFVSKYIGIILKAIDNCAELDALLSLVDVSKDQNYIKPDIVMEHIIDIKDGRDPLYELFDNYVSNDYKSSNNTSFIKIFSGPNACGKTIYMKQIALIVYLSHIGCFVPAKKAKIGIVTHILTQMSSLQTISEDASAYLIDLRQINNIIYSSTPNSLILMDEFGRGTSEIDSLAILTSILKNFIERDDSCPHILCATHIHRVAQLLPLSPIIELKTFEFIVDNKKQVTFLYRLINGKSGKSFAHTVARSTGLSDNIVDRAEIIFNYMKKGKLPRCHPDEDRRNIIKYIADIQLQRKNIHIDELRQWLHQAFYRQLPSKFSKQ